MSNPDFSSLRYADLRHDCDKPDTDHLPNYGERGQVIARWRCPVCKTRWRLEAGSYNWGHFYWERSSGPSWRWERAERRRLAEEANARSAA